ncbi:MAG: NAD(P)H-hydrate epimerase [Candidatus Omnitrophica bacterium]|nr:NAD(P)H-hydrate epimerase [Candidatus Omnitrophota bacterium]
MQQIDTEAIETCGIPRLLLMEHAGLAVANAAASLSAAPAVLVCCGTGYNGGDGLCAARHLSNRGYAPRVVLAGRLDHLRDEPMIYANIVRRLGIPLAECTSPADLELVERWVASSALIIDALLGIGVRGTVREPVASLIDRLNASGKPIVAADIPSGLDADTGLPLGCAVKATVTVTFGLPKRGCVDAQGPAHVGTLIVDPITIPRTLLERS